MAFIPVPGCIQARLIWQEDNGAVGQNVLWHAFGSVVTIEDLELLGETWQDVLAENVMLNVTPNWRVNGVNLRAMNVQDGLALNFNEGFPIDGNNVGGALPDQVSYTVTLNTPFIGRTRRGRMYGFGLPSNGVQGNNRLAAPTQAELQTRWSAVLEAFQTANFPLAVVSFVEDGVPRTEGLVTEVTSVNVRFPLATQRRRLA